MRFWCAVPAWAQSPDTILVNGKILTVDAQSSVREALADSRRPHRGAVGTSAEMRKLAGPQSRVIDLQGRTVIPGLDRLASARDPRRPELHDRGQLDRRAHARGGARPRQGRRAHDEAGIVADRRRRMESAAVQGEPPADAGGARGRRAGESGLHPARLRVGDADAARAQDARPHQRSRPAGRWTLRARSAGAIDWRRHRPSARHRRALRQAAAPDLRRAGPGHEGVLPRAQSTRHHRRRRSLRQQHDRRELSGAVQGLEGQGA